jgi:anti-sigma-K factor RskA
VKRQPGLDCDEVRDLAPLYVLGALEADEMAAVRAHLDGCPEAHAEFRELGSVVPALLETVEPEAPPPDLRRRVLAAAYADMAERRHPAATPMPRRVVPMKRVNVGGSELEIPDRDAGYDDVDADARAGGVDRMRGPRRYLGLAAAILIFAIGAFAFNLQQDLTTARGYRDGVEAALQLAAQPGSLTTILVGDGREASGLAVVGTDGEVRLAMQGLDGTSGTEVYTAWAIAGDGAPVPIGTFTVGRGGTAVARAEAPVAVAGMTVALTLEPGPGATTPTLPIVAAGVAAPPAG